MSFPFKPNIKRFKTVISNWHKTKSVEHTPLVFGSALDPTSDEIPPFILNCVEYLYMYGSKTEGIFRISPESNEVNNLAIRYNQGEDIDLCKSIEVKSETGSIIRRLIDPHVVAALLKKYFRELKDPLCTSEMYDMWIATSTIKNERLFKAQIRKLLHFLPPVNYKVFMYLIVFFNFLCSHSEKTKMNAINFGICFGPNIFRPRNDSNVYELLDESPIANQIFSSLIQNSEYYLSSQVD